MAAARVCMLVRNDCRTDYRVIKEAGSLARAGYAVTVVAINTYGPLEREQRDGFEIVRVPIHRGRTEAGRFLQLFPAAYWRMARAAAVVKAHVYHAHDGDALVPAWLAARRTPGAKLLYDAHEVGFVPNEYRQRPGRRQLLSPKYLLALLIERTLVTANDWVVRHGADGVITVNDTLADLQAEYYDIQRPDIVMNCPPRFVPTEQGGNRLASALGVGADTPIVVCQGMFSLARGDGVGLTNMVRSAASLKSGVVAFIGNVGDDPQFAELCAFARQPQFAGKVFFIPRVPPTELLSYTAGATVGVIPLILAGLMRFASPNKLFEYLAVGLPVVVGDMPPAERICADYGCGMTCDFSSVDAIAATLDRLLQDPDLRATMQAGARRAAEAFNWETQEQNLYAVYHRLLGEAA